MARRDAPNYSYDVFETRGGVDFLQETIPARTALEALSLAVPPPFKLKGFKFDTKADICITKVLIDGKEHVFYAIRA